MEIIYKAFDGTTFESKTACMEYEEKYDVSRKLKTTILINVEGNLISPTSFMDDPSLPYYMVIHNREEFDVINNHLKKNGEPNLDELYLRGGKGCLYWDENTEQWENYEYLRENYFEHSRFLEEFYLQM
jgi:hypothetical protein